MSENALPKKTNNQTGIHILVGVIISLYALLLALAPAVRLHEKDFSLNPSYLLPWLGWLAGAIILDKVINTRIRNPDPWVPPLVMLLTGWGILTIWRLSPALGAKQLVWFIVGVLAITAALYLPNLIVNLKKYKYVWLALGLLLIVLTFFIGVNPTGSGPSLWLNIFGIYILPSEPLKLLLIVYLAAFFSDQIKPRSSLFASILPTLLIIALSGLLLIWQRDLGTAALILALFAFMLVVTTHRRRFLWIFPLVLVLGGVAGYFLIDVVRARVDIWLHPWLETGGSSYQLVQAQIAIAAGKLIGVGPGMGSPQFVPVAVSDFIFSALAEETGLLGTTALLLVLLLLVFRGIKIALTTRTTFGRYLAFGIAAYFGLQSFLIIGGNLALIPLTGITLPFLSYGGSSLLTNMFCAMLLLVLGSETGRNPLPERTRQPYLFIGAVILILFLLLFVKNSYLSVFKQQELVERPENLRWAVYDRYSPRGDILTVANEILATTQGEPGEYTRSVTYPQLSHIIGYTNALYGQSGLERSVYPFLRGYGKTYGTYYWHEILYNQPPAGSDVRINIDLPLQKAADSFLGERTGAIVLINAKTGEIYALVSHPSFNANTLESDWQDLMASDDAPLLNRATQAEYPLGTLSNLFGLSAYWTDPENRYKLPEFSKAMDTQCYQAMKADGSGLDGLRFGCESTTTEMLYSISEQALLESADNLGLFSAPTIALEVAEAVPYPDANTSLEVWAQGFAQQTVTPLQMVLAAAAITNDGVLPAPKLVNSYQDESGNWMAFADQGTQTPAISADVAAHVREAFSAETQAIWFQNGHAVIDTEKILTWYIGGTMPEWTGIPLAIAIAIEGDAPGVSQEIGSQLLNLNTD